MTIGSLSLCVAMLMLSVLESRRPLLAQAPKEITNSIGMKLVRIPEGTFTMGSPIEEAWRLKNEVPHEVTISKDFYLGVYEVTQSQYEKVIGKNPSNFQGEKVGGLNEDLPVEQVSWDDAVEFCKRLSELPEEKKSGRIYRLPTESEWEYACRAGSKTAYSFDDEPGLLPEYGWFDRNSSNRTHTVGLREPNAWGLYDMYGNVWEWCSDWYGDYPKGAITDPAGPKKGSDRVYRGGCWNYGAALCRSAYRYRLVPSLPDYSSGFRVALNSPEIPESPKVQSSEPQGSGSPVEIRLFGRKDRGREDALVCVSPPSKPDRRISRIRLSSR